MIQSGGYAKRAAIPQHAAFAAPDGIDDVEALALLARA
jgi:NADPH:quinone reductase-like Zn-dependent oxidoreductase